MTTRQCPCGKLDQLRRGMCHNCYERERRAGRIDSLVNSEEARGHIVMLRVNGWRYREVARAAGIDRSLLTWIVNGRKQIGAKTARAICAIDPAARADYVMHISPVVAVARARKAVITLGSDGCSARARKAAATLGPEGRSERTRRANAARTPEQRREIAFKVWATRRRNLGLWSYEELRVLWELRAVRQPVPAPPPWTDAALCAQVDQEMFFPEKGSSNHNAKRICRGCPVREKCLDFALQHDIEHGVFGGLSVKERKRILRTRGQDTPITA